MKRHATAHWEGSGKEGKGHVSTQSTTLNNTQYSFSSRFEEGVGTNPEELVAAAHAGCFTMKLSFVLGAAGFTADSIDTRCDVTLNREKGLIEASNLTVTAKVPGIDKAKFEECVATAAKTCPISQTLTSTAITHSATLA
jgi:osmotically inducible protein OsmC